MRTLSSIIGVAIVLVAATCPVRAQDTPPSEQLSGAVELRHGANQSSAASQRKIDSLGDQTDALFDEGFLQRERLDIGRRAEAPDLEVGARAHFAWKM